MPTWDNGTPPVLRTGFLRDLPVRFRASAFFHKAYILGLLLYFMAEIISELGREHSQLLELLSSFEHFADREEVKSFQIMEITRVLDKVWTEHEIKEEKFFKEFYSKGHSFPTTKMLLDEHRELRGHWKIVLNSVYSNDNEKLRVALDTDGRMLIDKLRRHIDLENKFLNFISEKNIA